MTTFERLALADLDSISVAHGGTAAGANSGGAPVSSGITEVRNSALAASMVLKVGPGSLVFLQVHNTSGGILSIMLINATSLPSNGPVSLLCPAMRVAAGSDLTYYPPFPITASTGIVVAGSTTDTFSLTIGTGVLEFYAQVR